MDGAASTIGIGRAFLLGALLAALLLPGTARAGAVTEFTVPTPNSQPAGITVGPDNALWFTEENGHKIGRITTDGTITEFPTPTANSGPTEIALGEDDALWFTEFAANPPKIGRLTTAGDFTEYDLPLGSGPDGITSGPDGALWFTLNGTSKIGRITTGGVLTDPPYDLKAGGFRPGDITAGPDGRLWFTMSEAHKIGAITTGGVPDDYQLALGSDPSGIAASGATLWFTQHGRDSIGRIPTFGLPITEFGPTGRGPSGITFGQDGALWFTETEGNKVGRMTTTGRITEFTIPTPGSEPGEIVAGPDGALWFTEFAGNKIGRIAAGSPSAGGAFLPGPLPVSPAAGAGSKAAHKSSCRVPKLRGLRPRRARKKLRKARCRYRIKGKGRVVSSRPRAGTRTRGIVKVKAKRAGG
jgi:virginiamycin B lyase